MATTLLRLDHDPLAQLRTGMVPIATPVVLEAYDWSTLADAREALQNIGIPLRQKLPRTHPLLLDISWVQRANPYPPLLAELNEAYGSGAFSFGYVGVDGRYHQLSYFYGETDTTPSFLIRKIRGDGTNGGDYYVCYAFLLTREIDPQPLIFDRTGKATKWHMPAPIIRRADWGTYAGGGYDGIKKGGITLLLTLIEMLLALYVFLKWKARRTSARQA